MDDYTKRYEAAKAIHAKARHFRGQFLNSIAVIEHEITSLLTEYFCQADNDKREIFFSEVIGKMSFNEKKKILIKIISKDYPNYWEEHKTYLNAFEEIKSFRNKLAHSIVDVSEEALQRPIEMGIGFIQWEARKPITDDEFNQMQVKANMIRDCLGDIKILLPFKERAPL